MGSRAQKPCTSAPRGRPTRGLRTPGRPSWPNKERASYNSLSSGGPCVPPGLVATILEGEKRKGQQNIWRKKGPKVLKSDKYTYSQEVEQIPSWINLKRFTLRHSVVKLSKPSDKGNLESIKSWLLIRNPGGQEAVRRPSPERKSCQPRILYLAKLSFKNEGEIKSFPDKQKQMELPVDLPYKR